MNLDEVLMMKVGEFVAEDSVIYFKNVLKDVNTKKEQCNTALIFDKKENSLYYFILVDCDHAVAGIPSPGIERILGMKFSTKITSPGAYSPESIIHIDESAEVDINCNIESRYDISEFEKLKGFWVYGINLTHLSNTNNQLFDLNNRDVEEIIKYCETSYLNNFVNFVYEAERRAIGVDGKMECDHKSTLCWNKNHNFVQCFRCGHIFLPVSKEMVALITNYKTLIKEQEQRDKILAEEAAKQKEDLSNHLASIVLEEGDED